MSAMHAATRIGVLAVSLLSLLGALSSTAGAVTWHNSGATAFTATGNPGTLTSTSVSTVCTSATATGTVPALAVGITYVSTGTVVFGGCSLSGQSMGVECSYTMTGFGQDGSGVGARTTGTADITCNSYLAGFKICHAAGTVSGSYVSASPAVTTMSTGGTVVVRNGAASCPLGNGDLLHLPARTQTTSSSNPPTITRTP